MTTARVETDREIHSATPPLTNTWLNSFFSNDHVALAAVLEIISGGFSISSHPNRRYNED